MDACTKRLGIALLVVAVTIGLNAYAVVSGFADTFYGNLFGAPSESSRVADVHHLEAAPVVGIGDDVHQHKQKVPEDLKPGCTRLVEYAFRARPGQPGPAASCTGQALIRI